MLENGLRLLHDEPLGSEGRRAQVVDGLAQVFSEADRGASPLRDQAALWAAAEAPGFERFSEFFRYLKASPYQGDPLAALAEAKAALDSMKAGEVVSHDVIGRLANLIELLLSGLRRDRLITPLVAPTEMKFS